MQHQSTCSVIDCDYHILTLTQLIKLYKYQKKRKQLSTAQITIILSHNPFNYLLAENKYNELIEMIALFKEVMQGTNIKLWIPRQKSFFPNFANIMFIHAFIYLTFPAITV